MPPRKRKQAARDTAPDPPANSASSLEPAKMTVAALREELDSRGLDIRGKKAELVARLAAELAGSTEGPSPTKKPKKEETKTESEPEEEPEVRKGRSVGCRC